MTEMTQTKAALIREPGYPTGKPAPCFLLCCNTKVYVPQISGSPVADSVNHCPECGAAYDGRGWALPTQATYTLKLTAGQIEALAAAQSEIEAGPMDGWTDEEISCLTSARYTLDEVRRSYMT